MNLPNLILKLVGVENRSHAPQFRTDAMEVVTYIDIGATVTQKENQMCRILQMIQVANLYLYALVATIQSDSITPNLAQPRIPDK